MIWLSLALLLVAFQRGWVLAPMILFALPFAAPLIASSLHGQGVELGPMIPDAIEGHAAHMVSLAGLSILALHQRRF